MKYIKTYGIDGLLEWHGVIESHGVKMKVDFTNGSLTAVGVAPATFTTKNELTQHIIENSDMFKSGRIRIIHSVELPGSNDKDTNVKAQSAAPVLDKDMNAPEAENGAGDKVTKVEVSSLDDAKEYLKENFNVAASKLRSRAAILEQAEANGIEFVGI